MGIYKLNKTKMKYATLAALMATASASGVGPHFKMIEPKQEKQGWDLKHWNLVPAFVKEASKDIFHIIKGDRVKAVTKITWAQCDDDKGVFKYDAQRTTASPDPLVPGQNVTLSLAGAISDDLNIDHVSISALWNKHQVYKQNFDVKKKYSDELSWQQDWFVPNSMMTGDWLI